MKKSSILWGALATLVVGAIVLLCPGCYADDNDAVRAAQDMGFTHVKIEDSEVFFISWSGCGQDDNRLFKFTATNPAGKQVRMLACCGSMKGCTIRSL